MSQASKEETISMKERIDTCTNYHRGAKREMMETQKFGLALKKLLVSEQHFKLSAEDTFSTSRADPNKFSLRKSEDQTVTKSERFYNIST
jgi:hypothetical protein